MSENPLAERKSFIKSFVKEVKVYGNEATLTYTVPMLPKGLNEERIEVLSTGYSGGAEGIRTPYLRDANATFSRVNYGPRCQHYSNWGRNVAGKEWGDLKSEDVIFVRRGSYRIGTVAMVSPLDIEVLLTAELVVMRVINTENEYGINPYYLIYLLSHYLTQQQLPQKILIDTILPNIADRWKELYLPVLKDKTKAAKISERIKSALQSKWKAQEDIAKLRTEFGGLTT